MELSAFRATKSREAAGHWLDNQKACLKHMKYLIAGLVGTGFISFGEDAAALCENVAAHLRKIEEVLAPALGQPGADLPEDVVKGIFHEIASIAAHWSQFQETVQQWTGIMEGFKSVGYAAYNL